MSGPTELEGLARAAEAGGADAPGAADPGASEGGALIVPQESPNLGAICFLMAGAREVLCLVLKVESPRRTLDDPKIEHAARVLAPVADKYGLNLAGVWNGPEGAAVMVAGPILWGAYKALRDELDARKPAPKPAADGQAAPDAEA